MDIIVGNGHDVWILHEDVCISYSANTIWKDMSTAIFLSVKGK